MKPQTARRKSSERLFGENQTPANGAANNRRSAVKKKTPPELTLYSSPGDLNLLAENQLFQAYQVVYYQDQSSHGSNPTSNGSAFSNPNSGFSTISNNVSGAKEDENVKNIQNQAQNQRIGLNGQKQSKVPHKPIEQLIIHNSDNQVKPIIGNKDIEKIAEVKVNPEALPF